jgi:hypothetical protein
MYANIVKVYEAVRELANKDQRGFVTPASFNKFAHQAQLNLFNNMFSEFEQSRASSRRGINAKGDKSRTKRLQEDLSFYSVTDELEKTNSENFFRKYSLDPDVSRIISISTAGGSLLGNSTRVPIDIVYDEEKIERILISDLNKPTEDYPVALVSDNIEVFPESINKIFVRYYRVPRGRSDSGAFSDFVPSLATTLTDQSGAVHFDMPEHYEPELALEIAKMIGLHLRDADMYNFSAKEEVPKPTK